MLPLTLVTGFLGSGKTTLLRRIADRDPTRRYVFVVNDFAQADVDGSLMKQTDSPVLSVAGGSIFCICKVTDFIERLNEVWDRFGQANPPVDGVIVEASGMADPRVVRKLIRDAELDDKFELRSVIGVVEPTSLMKLLQTLPNIRAQIEASDVVLVNKADLHDEAAMRTAELELAAINPQCKLMRTTHCDVSIDPLAPFRARMIDGDYADCRDPHYYDVTVTAEVPVDLPAFRAKVAAMAEAVFRIKGMVQTDSGWRYVEYAGGRWAEDQPTDPQHTPSQPPPQGEGSSPPPSGRGWGRVPDSSPERPALAIIGHGPSAKRIDELAAMVSGTTNTRVTDMA